MRTPCSHRRRACGFLTLSLLLSVVIAIAGARLAQAEYAPLTDGRYRIDLNLGPVLGSTRVIGLGGAYASIAEGAAGITYNPASVAHRPRYSYEWFAWDLTFDYIAPGSLHGEHFDFDNNNRSLPSRMHTVHMGGQFQIGSFGAGCFIRIMSHDFNNVGTPARDFHADLGLVQIPVGYGLFNHQLILGCGLRIGYLRIYELGGVKNRFTASMFGFESGALLRPAVLPFRFAVVLHTPMRANVETDSDAGMGTPFYPPGKGVAIPWELRFGVSWFLNRRKYNESPAFMNPPTEVSRVGGEGRSPLKPSSGFSFLVSFELVIIGKAEDAIGIDGFLEQVNERAGRQVSFSPRLGVETEVWPDRLRVRSGLYWEPSRADDYDGRLHAAFATDVRVLEFFLFGKHSLQASVAMDFAPRYSTISFSLGFWH
ncbi:MAG: hypothetical protein ACYTHM_06625 [Planctomycetota bacterium]|jgi:hypothetical protein